MLSTAMEIKALPVVSIISIPSYCLCSVLSSRRLPMVTMTIHTLSIDIETYSDVDLSKCGVYRYTESDNFEILLFGYAVDGGSVSVIAPSSWRCSMILRSGISSRIIVKNPGPVGHRSIICNSFRMHGNYRPKSQKKSSSFVISTRKFHQVIGAGLKMHISLWNPY